MQESEIVLQERVAGEVVNEAVIDTTKKSHGGKFLGIGLGGVVLAVAGFFTVRHFVRKHKAKKATATATEAAK